MIVKDIVKCLDNLAPSHLAEKWDNVGLLLGSMDKEVNKVLLSLDISPDTVKKAMKIKADIIITHHPLIFDGLKRIIRDDNRGKMLYNLISNDISVLAIHTNLDSCLNGVSDILAEKMGLKERNVLVPTYSEVLYKLVVFAPHGHEEQVRAAISEHGGGDIGNYSSCTFNTEGVGTFMPKEGTNPYIGKIGQLEKVNETRIETVVPKNRLKAVIKGMQAAHPYEEVAYDVYKLENSYITYGHGRTGMLQKPMTLSEIGKLIKDRFCCDSLRIYGNLDKKIQRIALCGGSGSDFIVDAHNSNADVYITGDIKYHDAQLASELGIALIDAGHYDTEKHILPYLKNYIINNINDKLEIEISLKNNYCYSTI